MKPSLAPRLPIFAGVSAPARRVVHLRRTPVRAFLLAGILAGAAALPARAQMAVPDTFTNLKVLPKDISKDQLVATMRDFTRALGVRCDYCHVESRPGAPGAGAPAAGGPPGAGAPGAGGPPRRDFASDDKPEKRIARGMLRMVRAINGAYLDSIADLDQPHPQVACMTCHHGVTEPRTLADVLLEAVSEKGAPAAVRDYTQLKQRYYGHGTYDFSEGTLDDVARQLTDAGKPDDALTMLALAEQEFPQSGNVPFLEGEALVKKGDKEGAIAKYKRALELQPNNRAARARLQELGGG